MNDKNNEEMKQQQETDETEVDSALLNCSKEIIKNKFFTKA